MAEPITVSIDFLEELRQRLKMEGSIPRVKIYGESVKSLEPPYIVLKPIYSADRKTVQVYIHFDRSQNNARIAAETYAVKELPILVKDFLRKMVSGVEYISKVHDTGNIAGIWDNDDGTLSMTRELFFVITSIKN
ncbi:hypothetical protein NO1_0592 [Candidatus Termititenax aidoneus]|uniref:Uncharacterized protein n=1 Tax=Termititenax aidoneus TaxID=2218524 RepID=A0A388TA71_TERA1|nr:hypothetical protein NO1_0592 [Candidatus Termititenax aidoneus]